MKIFDETQDSFIINKHLLIDNYQAIIYSPAGSDLVHIYDIIYTPKMKGELLVSGYVSLNNDTLSTDLMHLILTFYL